jgi:4-amino-4-deoxy-L-arabinose transferase-like glycosyltransferase
VRRVSLRARVGPWLLVLALGLLLYLPGLGREILRHPLEAKYAMAAREMTAGGPWLVAQLFGALYPDKPPLYFWATAGVAELRGGRLDEVTARIPAVIGALVSLALTLALGEALFGRKAALVSALVLATSGLFFWYARQGHPDQFLVASVTGACLGLWKSFTAREGATRTGWVALAWVAMGVGVLSKGLLGLVLPLLAGALYLGAIGPLRALPRRLGLWPGLLLWLAVVGCWYGPAVARHGAAYLRETLVHQQVERYARSWVHHGPWYQYFGDFVTGFLPWSIFVPGALVLAWRARRDGADGPHGATVAAGAGAPAPWLFPLCWFGGGFVFFSLSTGKRAAYLLPLYPAAALLVGWLWVHAVAPPRTARWLGVPVGLLAGIAGLLAAVAAVHGLGGLILPRHAIPGRMVDTLVPADPTWQLAAALILLAGATAVWLSWRRGRRDLAFAAVVAATALGLLGITLVRAPQYEARYPVRELSRSIAGHVPPDERVLSLLDDYDFLVAFYLDREVVPIPGPSELLAARRAAPRFALIDNNDRALLTEPGVTVLTEGRLGPKRILLLRLDKASG